MRLPPVNPRVMVGVLVSAAAICAGICRAAGVGVVLLPAGVLLALYLPGAAVVLSIDPHRKHVRGAARAMWVPLASLGILIAGGIILNEVSALTRLTWAVYEFCVVLLAGGVAWLRGGGEHHELSDERSVLTGRWTRVSGGSVGLLVCASVVVAGALGLSVYSSNTASSERFVQLWMLPVPATAGAYATRVQIGLSNDEGAKIRFAVTVRDGGVVLLNNFLVTLNAGQQWTKDLPRKGHTPMTATVARASHAAKILDSVKIATPVR